MNPSPVQPVVKSETAELLSAINTLGQNLLVLGKFGPRPIGTWSGPDQTQRSRFRSGIFPKTPDRLVPGLSIPILPQTVSDPVWTGTA